MIRDPLSCTYGNEIESKGVQFPGQNAPVKIRGGGYPDISKTVAFCHKNTKIRMRSDEHHHRQSKSPPSGPECREKSGTFLRSRATNLNYNKTPKVVSVGCVGLWKNNGVLSRLMEQNRTKHPLALSRVEPRVTKFDKVPMF